MKVEDERTSFRNVEPWSARMLSEKASAMDLQLNQERAQLREVRQNLERLQHTFLRQKEEVFNEVSRNLEYIQERRNQIDEAYKRILGDPKDSSFVPIEKRIENASSKVNRAIESIEFRAMRLREKQKKLEDFFEKVFGTSNEGGEVVDSLDHKVDEALKKSENLLGEQNQKCDVLFDRIEALLPGATAVGLTKSFSEMRKSFEKSIKIWNLSFVVSIAFMLLIAFTIFVGESHDGKLTWEWGALVATADSTRSFECVAKRVLSLLPFYIPCIWFAVFSAKRRSESRRLEQEYAHKESVASSYENYRKQAEMLAKEGIKMEEKLLDGAVGALLFNASSTLDKKCDEKSPFQDLASSITSFVKHKEP